MIKLLEKAIEQIKVLPPERQAYAALVLQQIAADDGMPFDIPAEHRAAVLEGLSQAERGEFASDADVERALRRPWD
jgi:antitoxin component of RelBE/YafQ-DinJ toxin-antitoxin module